jgi:AraC-like DNA-binding protein
MAAYPTISAGYPRGLLDFAVSKGANRDALLRRSGLNEHDWAHQDNHVALDRYLALFNAAAELTGEPAIALQFGEAVRMQEVSIVGLICEACETTIDVGRELNRYAALVLDDARGEPATLMRGVWRDGGLWIETPHDLFNANPPIVEAEFARLVWNGRVMFANSEDFKKLKYPRVIHFTHADPGYAHEYARVFQAPVVFNSHWNAMQIDPEFLTLKQPPVNRYVFGVLSERADALLKNLQASKTTRARVESLLVPMLHKGEVSMETIADKMGLSRQSLYRSLKAEGVTYELVLDELRHKLAVNFLADKKVSVNEAAYLVGFSEPAAFSRAFKRWTGASPRAARKA